MTKNPVLSVECILVNYCPCFYGCPKDGDPTYNPSYDSDSGSESEFKLEPEPEPESSTTFLQPVSSLAADLVSSKTGAGGANRERSGGKKKGPVSSAVVVRRLLY